MVHFREYYVSGGTLHPDAASYVERRADRDLFATLSRGELGYLLTARQTGKSSLMVRTAVRLRGAGIRAVLLDLTVLGGNTTPEQWYFGLLTMLGKRLQLSAEFDTCWRDHQALSPLRRFMLAVETVALPHVVGLAESGPRDVERSSQGDETPQTTAPMLVIFLDEIDAVRSLPFSTNEFFAAIRELYNRRAEEPRFRSLSFCLLGVATLADLIRDPQSTPFNIGRRIDLEDFTAEEALPLAAGLTPLVGANAARRLLRRVLYWTAGHPYLTQKLCLEVAECLEATPGVALTRLRTADVVDRVCAAMFFSPGALERDESLLFVQERLLRSPSGTGETPADLVERLHRYGQIRGGSFWPWARSPVSEPDDPVTAALRLSGIVRVEAGKLRPRNRIYARLFDAAWIRAQMPDAEVRRQRAAYRRGVLRAAAICGLVIAGMGLLLRSREEALDQMRAALARAERAELREQGLRRLADRRGEELRRQVSRIHVQEGMRLVDAGDPLGGLSRYVEAMRVDAGGAEAERSHRVRIASVLASAPRLVRLWRYADELGAADFSPDGSRLITSDGGASVRLWRSDTGAPLAPALDHSGGVEQLSFSPDGSRFVVATRTGWIYVRSSASGGLEWKRRLRGAFPLARFSVDGRALATGDRSGEARVWSAATGRPLMPGVRHGEPIARVALSPDRRLLATAGGRSARIWNAHTGGEVSPHLWHEGPVWTLEFASNNVLATARDGGAVQLWNARTGGPHGALQGEEVILVRRGGRDRLLVQHQAGIVRIWDTASRRQVIPDLTFPQPLVMTSFAADNTRTVTLTADGVYRSWHAGTGSAAAASLRLAAPVRRAWCSPDQRYLLSTSRDGLVRLWDLVPPQALPAPAFGDGRALKISDDGSLVVVAEGEVVRLRDGASGASRGVFRHGAPVTAAALSGDGRFLASGGADGAVRVWDLGSARELAPPQRVGGGVSWLRISHDGGWVLCGSAGRSSLWSTREPGRRSSRSLGRQDDEVSVLVLDRLASRLSGGHARLFRWRPLKYEVDLWWRPPGEAASPVFSPDGRRILVPGPEGKVLQRESRTGKALGPALAHAATATWACYSPDGRRIATGCSDGSARVWDAATGVPITVPLAHGEPVRHLAFGPEGRQLATLTASGSARLWDARTGAPLTAPRRLGEGWGEVVFTPDGRRLLALFSEGRIVAWDLSPSSLSLSAMGHLAELLSGYRYDPAAGFTPLPAGVTEARWQALKGAAVLRPPAYATLRWHQAEASRAEAHRQWEAAVRHLSRLLADDTHPADLYRRRAAAHAELGRWREAARDYTRVLTAGRAEYPEWYRAALTALAAGDAAGYRTICARMLDRFEGSDEARPKDITAWTCALGRAAPRDTARAMRLIRTLLAREPDNASWNETLGALCYRAGRFDEARECLEAAAVRDEQGGSAVTLHFLSMVYRRLRSPEAARGARLRARQRRARDGEAGLAWDDRLERSLLQREAETMRANR